MGKIEAYGVVVATSNRNWSRHGIMGMATGTAQEKQSKRLSAVLITISFVTTSLF